MSNTNQFVQDYYQNPHDKPLLKRVGGMLPVSKNVFNEEITDLKVDSVVNAIHLQKIASHLGIELEDVTNDAVHICGMKQEAKVFEKKVSEYEHREHQYANGSIMEKARRWVGSAPVDPRKNNEQPVINITLPENLLGTPVNSQMESTNQRLDGLEERVGSLMSLLEKQFEVKQQA